VNGRPVGCGSRFKKDVLKCIRFTTNIKAGLIKKYYDTNVKITMNRNYWTLFSK